MRTLIAGGTILTPESNYPDHTLVIEDQKIVSIEPRWLGAGHGEQLVDARGLWVAAGMIDLHIHGSAGYDTMDATNEALEGMARFLVRHGVTAYLATTMAASPERILAAVRNVAAFPLPRDGAQHLGVHLEGPYLNPMHKGAQPERHLRPPDAAEYEIWLDSGVVRLITLAPELEGALFLIQTGSHRGVEFAVGHSGASYERVLEAVDYGLQQATHVFNGMPGLHHRTPGVVGAVLSDDRIYAQLIADGVHLHPAVVKLIVRAKGVNRTILISDAMRAAGLADGEYDLGGHAITVREGVARTAVGGLAGSTLTLDAALRNVIRCTGLGLNQALAMCTSTPAGALGLAGHKGVMLPGADADIVLLDADLQVRMTVVAGHIVHQNI